MSEILFKGKRVDNGELVEGDFLQSDGQCFIIPSMGVCCVEEYQYAITSKFIQLYAYEIYPETVCQYTGLTDKNGKKIFEGDLLSHKLNRVEMLNGMWCVNGDRPLFLMAKECEVIGNIFDNPDLLTTSSTDSD